MRVLIIDDDLGLRQSLGLLLDGEGYDVSAESAAERGLERALVEPFDVILCDVRMPGIDGLEFLRRYKGGGGSALVVMMSAYGNEDSAIEAMKQGAYDYLPKPFRPDEVVHTLRKASERERLRDRVASLEAELERWRDADIVADSAPMRRVMDLATRVAAHTTTVLVTGESGTGKEVVARAIHRMSPRRGGPFVAINCGAIPENLLESELFGHKRGAFTGATSDKAGLFEEADGGTLLLDEIGDLPLALQVKLLRALQEGEVRRVGDARTRKVDVRVIAATAKDIEAAVKAGQFREDLYYRLNVVRIHIPPLRERPDDLEGLVATLLKRVAERSGRDVQVQPDAMNVIRRSPWRGNVRELENALERAAVLSSDGVIRPDAFAGEEAWTPHASVAAPARQPASDAVMSLKAAVDRAEREAIIVALAETGGNRQAAAQVLGISVRSLFYKIKRLGVP